MNIKKYQRENGRMIFNPETNKERIEAFKWIVENKELAKIDNCAIDLFSASAVVQVYEALNESNKEMFSKYPANKMALIALKLIK